MNNKKSKSSNLNDDLKKLEEITQWFENQEEADIEKGLIKVKEAAKLIKISKERLKDIENEFNEIKKEIDDEEIIENNISK